MKFPGQRLRAALGARAIPAASTPAIAAVQVIDFQNEATANVCPVQGHHGGLDWLNW